MTDQELIAQAERIAAELEQLQETIGATEGVQLRTTRVERLTSRLKLWTVIAVAGLILDLSLTILGATLFVQQRDTTDKINVVQSKVSTEALCPLYNLFLGAYNPARRPAGTSLETYEQQFAVIRAGHKALGCP